MLEAHTAKLNALSSRWQDLEERIKGSEQVTGEVCIPAINELRYSGRRFLEAWLLASNGCLDETAKGAFEAHIQMAEQYFNNADHDLVDALVSFYVERRSQLLNRYSVTKATTFYTRFTAWTDLVSDAQKLIRHSRGNRSLRILDYQKLQLELLPKLEDNYLEIVREEITFKRKAKIANFIRGIVSVGGVIGWLAGIICLVAEWDKAIPIIKGFFHIGVSSDY